MACPLDLVSTVSRAPVAPSVPYPLHTDTWEPWAESVEQDRARRQWTQGSTLREPNCAQVALSRGLVLCAREAQSSQNIDACCRSHPSNGRNESSGGVRHDYFGSRTRCALQHGCQASLKQRLSTQPSHEPARAEYV